MKTFYIHIGLHKTGSTAIQYMLSINRSKLLQQGVLYPQSGLRGRAHHNLAWAIYRWPERMPHWQRMHEEVDCSGVERIVLSSEEFEFMQGVQQWRRLRDEIPGDLKVVCYLRRQDRMLLSEYNEQVKQGSFEGFDSFRERMAARLDYLSRLSVIENAVGRESLIVRSYDRLMANRGILVDFLSIVGIDPAPCRIPADRINPSLSPVAIRVMLVANRFVRSSELRSRVLNFVRKCESLWTSGHTSLLSSVQRTELLLAYAHINREIEKRYLGAADRPLFPA